ncbi:BTB/POZ domain-containing protein 6-like [Gordionus sp. m RMFG-2023]|uniref:BTB/POZ domain-containing protein 6-like n=1 Tax=Gordionus sp. m RMFG-2023 TaxID=3053472 RepID=UPI0031FD8CBF
MTIGKSLYNNSYMSDVRFEVEGEIMYAHKFILSLKSEMFYSMFHGSIGLDSCIKIEDLSKHAFRKILQYMYTQIFVHTIDLDSLIQTLYGAKKYMLKDLIKICLEQITDYDINGGCTSQLNNYDSIGYTPPLINDEVCEGFVTQILLQNEKFVFDSDGFLNSPIPLIKNFITLVANSKMKLKEISEFLIKWAKNECCKRQISNDSKNVLCILSDSPFISYIMDSDLVDMIDIVREHNLLDDTEILKILIEKRFRITCK